MRTILLTAATLALAACGSNADTADQATNAAIDNMNTAAASGMATDTGTAAATAMGGAQQFVDTVAASDQFEIQSSELAQTKTTSKAVKDFAAMMIDHHTKSSADLKQAAMGASPAVTPAAQLTAAQQSDLDALRNAGADFDRVYAEKQVAAHEKAKALLSDFSATGAPGPLRDFASKTVTVVSNHLEQARKLPK